MRLPTARHGCFQGYGGEAAWTRVCRGAGRLVVLVAGMLGSAELQAQRAQTTLTIATVNNSDMVIMQRLSKQFEQQHPEIRLDWVILEGRDSFPC